MAVTLNANSSTGFIATSDTSGVLQLQTGGTTAVTVDASQNVGIGTASPQRTLHVENSSGNLVRLNNSSSANGSYSSIELTSTGGNNCQIRGVQDSSTAGHLEFYTLSASAVSERMRIDSSGNVGIGTSSPSQKLHLSGSNVSIRMDDSTSNYSYAMQVTSSAFRWYDYNAAAERMRIDSGGNLLVGTTAIEGVGGFTIRPNLGGAGSYCRLSLNSNGTNDVFNFLQNGTQVGRIQIAATQVFYVTTSDYRLKENIQPMKGALAKVAALNPVTYTWKATGEVDQGFIAHELQAVCPNAVVGEKDAVNEDGSINPQGIDTSFLVATLTAAIQELKALVDTQASTITQLQADVAALKGASA